MNINTDSKNTRVPYLETLKSYYLFVQFQEEFIGKHVANVVFNQQNGVQTIKVLDQNASIGIIAMLIKPAF